MVSKADNNPKSPRYSSEWGTNEDILTLVDAVFGGIDIDLASSEWHNRRVKAKRIFTARIPCPFVVAPEGGKVVFSNPPGPSGMVARFWAIWCLAIAAGNRGAFVLFSIDHWRQLCAPGFPVWCLVLRKRQAFVRTPEEIAEILADPKRAAKYNPKGTANFSSVLVLSHVNEQDRDLLRSYGHLVRWEA